MEFTYKNLKEMSRAINNSKKIQAHYNFDIYKINKNSAYMLFNAKVGDNHNENLKSLCKSLGMHVRDIYKGRKTDFLGRSHYIRVSYYKKDHDTLLALLRMK